MVLLIKATDKKALSETVPVSWLTATAEGGGGAEKNDQYEQLLVNPACFASDEEDGGVYFAPLGRKFAKATCW